MLATIGRTGKFVHIVLVSIIFFSIFISACPPANAEQTIWQQRDIILSQIQAGDSNSAQAAINNLQQNFAQAIWLQRNTIISKIKAGDNSQAQAAIDNLQQDYSDQNQISRTVFAAADEYRQQDNVLHETILKARYAGCDQISQVVCETADEYQKQGNATKANELYRKILNDWPEGSHAVWAKMHLTTADIKAGNTAAAEADVNSLIANFSSRDVISQVVCEVADEYRKQGDAARANALYRKILNDWPNSSHAIWAKTYLIASDIQSGNVSAAQAGIDNLTANFSSQDQLNPSFSFAVLGLAERCYEAELGSLLDDPNKSKLFMTKAIELLDGMARQDIADSMLKATVFYEKGLSCQAGGDYRKAAEAYQQAVETNPRYEYADYCVFTSGRCYEKLLVQKAIPETEAKTLIRAQYEKLLRDYPQSSYARLASRWLAK